MERRPLLTSSVFLIGLGFSIAAVGCGGGPRASSSSIEGEAQFLAPYARMRAEQCDGRAFALTLGDRPGYVILTDPPIFESAWVLRTCDGDVHFLLDCSDREDGKNCGAHDWPKPKYEEEELTRELEAVAAVAPTCPIERSCRRRKESMKCAGDGVTFRRHDARDAARIGIGSPSSGDFATTLYDVERCGIERAVVVRCEYREPFRCITRWRDQP